MNDKPLNTAYADLFDGDDPGLALLIADLDALYSAPEPPANMQSRFEHLLRQREQRARNGRVSPSLGAIPPAAHGSLPLPRPEPIPLPLATGAGPRARLRQIGGIAAALVVFAMVAIVLAQIFGAGGDDDGQQAAPVDATPTGQIAFVSERDGNAEIYLINADGSGLRRLTDNPASDTEPDWSPDGERIAFVSDRDGARSLYVMDADGSNVGRLTQDGLSVTAPLWSPDGQWIAFAGSEQGVNADVYVIRLDGSNLRMRLTAHPGAESALSWSANSLALAYQTETTPAVAHNIYLVEIASAETYNLTYDVGPNERLPDLSREDSVVDQQFPDWSPDNVHIAYASAWSESDELPEIAIRHRHIPAIAGVTETGVLGTEPRWSPDGQWIAFRDEERQLVVMRADVSDQRRLTDLSGTFLEYDWAPDSQHLVFATTTGDERDGLRSDASLYTVSIDGAEPRLLTDEAMPQARPVWRPDPAHAPPLLPTPAPTPSPADDLAARASRSPFPDADVLHVVQIAEQQGPDGETHMFDTWIDQTSGDVVVWQTTMDGEPRSLTVRQGSTVIRAHADSEGWLSLNVTTTPSVDDLDLPNPLAHLDVFRHTLAQGADELLAQGVEVDQNASYDGQPAVEMTVPILDARQVVATVITAYLDPLTLYP
ncbi:MAG TPA: DPP IV N-terminal domain-containing protein, partial [Thermomicrobiales bacterium]|nr:DPP IV N-terminal domain-containing protein [Thermomicrobiales bacterium]